MKKDPLAELNKFQGHLCEDGRYILKVEELPREITNIDKLSGHFDDEYGLSIDQVDIEEILDGKKDGFKHKPKNSTDEIDVDKEFIKKNLFVNAGRHALLLTGAVNKMQAAIAALNDRITELEGDR